MSTLVDEPQGHCKSYAIFCVRRALHNGLPFGPLCGTPTPPQLLDQCGTGDGIESAPIVIVGVLTSDILVRRPVPMHSDPTYPLQLRRLTVTVENVLKGPQVPAEITVY